nr:MULTISPECIES: hypothetical protein [unclassified Caballeronia]
MRPKSQALHVHCVVSEAEQIDQRIFHPEHRATWLKAEAFLVESNAAAQFRNVAADLHNAIDVSDVHGR